MTILINFIHNNNCCWLQMQIEHLLLTRLPQSIPYDDNEHILLWTIAVPQGTTITSVQLAICERLHYFFQPVNG